MVSGPDLSQFPFSGPEKGRFDDSYENNQMLHMGRFYDQPKKVKKQVLKPAWVGTLRGLTV